MNAQDKRRRILEAASECLARYGYEKTTLDDIAGRIGLNKTSLYYYYPNKEAIFTAVLVEEAKSFLATLQAKALNAQGCREQLLTYLTERFRYYQHVVNLHNLSVETLRSLHPSFKTLYQDVLNREAAFIGDLLKTGIKRGEIRPGPVNRLARLVLTLADALKREACEAPGQAAPEAIDYAEVEKEVVYAVNVIMDGLVHDPPCGPESLPTADEGSNPS